jgi:hypothetical protein
MRPLPVELEEALETGTRRPAYKILAFDPKLDSMSEIIAGTYSQTPLNLTPYCSEITWQPGQLQFVLKDETGRFHPDTGADARYLVDKAIIRLKEGDSRVSEGYWMWTFTGAIQGQLGWKKSRRQKTMQAQVTAYNRENNQALKRRKITTQEYSVGTDLGVMFRDVAENFLGLTDLEIRVPPIWGRTFMHKTNQVSQLSPWETLSTLLQVVCQVPFFDGEGRLAAWSKDLNRWPDRILPDYVRVFDLEVSGRTQDCVNKVRVKFLDSRLEEVEGPFQVLGRANITTGFFTFEENLDCYWSEDRKQRARNTELKIIKSVNDNLLPVGSESYQEMDEFHGRITVTIAVWVPILAGAMLAGYLAAAWVPDDVVCGFGSGFTIPTGRAAQAACLTGILIIMMSLGSAQYEVWGTPYDLVYLEKESVAVEYGLEYWEEVEKEFQNDFIGSHDQADAVAVKELIYEKSASLPRKLTLEDDLALEVGDIVQLPDGRKVFIQDMRKQIKRGDVPILEIQGFKVMTA